LNNLLRVDSYKIGHANMYPATLTRLYAYLESRVGGKWDKTLWFGLQHYLREYFTEPFFSLADIDHAELFCRQHFERNDYFPRERWESLYRKYQGWLPLSIRALPEGSVVAAGTPLMVVESTDPEFPWLATYVETLLMKVWYPSTVATQSYYLRAQLDTIFNDTCNTIPTHAVHDFGYRGVATEEQAALGGAAHLISFFGSDNLAGINLVMEDYPLLGPVKMPGNSIPATEHSIIMAHESEFEAFQHVLNLFPDGPIACVSDTVDFKRAVSNLWLGDFHGQVMRRNGTLVMRPDSGDMYENIVYALSAVANTCYGEGDDMGYYRMNRHYRLIQGDGMDYESIPSLFAFLVEKGYSPDNLVVGSGGGLLQKLNRDTLRFAYKVSEIERDGETIAVSKQPATDMTKASKAGRMDESDMNVVYSLELGQSDPFVKTDESMTFIRERAAYAREREIIHG
jgi:nicotinamide phosphoribosyltransferase